MSGKNKLRKNQYVCTCVYTCVNKYNQHTTHEYNQRQKIDTTQDTVNIQSTYNQRFDGRYYLGVDVSLFKTTTHNISTAHKNMWCNISTAHKNMRPYISMLQEYATLYLLAPEIMWPIYLLSLKIKQYISWPLRLSNISTAHKNMWPNISWPQRLCDQYISTAHKNMWTYISWTQRLSKITKS